MTCFRCGEPVIGDNLQCDDCKEGRSKYDETEEWDEQDWENYRVAVAETLNKQVEKFNALYTIGDKVNVKQDDGSIALWTVKYKASLLGGHTAVIWCEEHSSCYSADRVIYKTTSKI